MASIHELLRIFTALFLLIHASSSEKRTHFTIDQVANPNHVSFSPEYLHARTLAKYGYYSRSLIALSLVLMNSSVETNPVEDDRSWRTPVTVGTDTMLVSLDTGSSDFWTFSSITAPSLKDDRPQYTPGPNAVELKSYNFSIGYGDGSFAFGQVFLDKVTLGNITVNAQAIEAAERMSYHFTADKTCSGVFGFGFGSLNKVHPIKQKTFFENAMPNLSLPVFASYMRHQAPGSYDIGFIDRKKYTGELTYTPVNNTLGFWDVKVLGYQIGNGSAIDAPFDAIVDTGTTFALLPPEIVKDYYSRIRDSEHYGGVAWYFPCNATIPDLGIRISENYTAYIPGKNIRYKQPSKKRNKCYGGLQAARYRTVLGSVFLKTQYAVFDYGQLRLGFAPQADVKNTAARKSYYAQV